MLWSVCEKLNQKRKLLKDEEVISLDYSKELYTSLFCFDENILDHLDSHQGSLSGYDGRVYGHYFVLDLDSAPHEFEQVTEAAVHLMRYLDHKAVRYYAFFSGGKGYHFYIPKSYVGNCDSYEGQWHLACKQFARQIGEEIIELQPWIDLSIYDKQRVFRYPFSRYPELFRGQESGKRLIMPDPDGKTKVVARSSVREKVLRDIFFGMDMSDQEEHEIFLLLRDPEKDKHTGVQSSIETTTVGELRIPKDEKICIYRMMGDRDCTGRRHEIGMRLMAYWREKFLLPQYIESNLRVWNHSMVKPLRDDELSGMMKYRDKYIFTCDDPVKQRYCAEECRFFRQKNRSGNEWKPCRRNPAVA